MYMYMTNFIMHVPKSVPQTSVCFMTPQVLSLVDSLKHHVCSAFSFPIRMLIHVALFLSQAGNQAIARETSKVGK